VCDELIMSYRAAATLLYLGACSSAANPSTIPHSAPQEPKPLAPRIEGVVSYDDGTPAAAASMAITSLDSGAQMTVAIADQHGKFAVSLVDGDYALTATAEHGFAWIEKQSISRMGITIKLTKECERISGRIVEPSAGGVQVNFTSHSFQFGDIFITSADRNGTFSLCLPRGLYTASLAGKMLSTGVGVTAPSDAPVQLRGHPTSAIKSAPEVRDRVPHDMAGLVSDIVRAQPRLVGLGEATHGSAEFVMMRSKLTFELARRAQLRLVLLENDAIAAMSLERYVNGEDVDLANAVASLGFWITDTYEFVQFMKDIRAYNTANPQSKMHVWGVDAQNTERPVGLLVSNASVLRLTSDDQALLQTVAPARGKAVKQFSAEQRSALDTLLLRLSEPAGSTDLDTQLAVAARSLAIQVGYMDGDTAAMYSANKYYPVGFYLYDGTSRAWDAGGKIGVISHTLGPAPRIHRRERSTFSDVRARRGMVTTPPVVGEAPRLARDTEIRARARCSVHGRRAHDVAAERAIRL
jgi:hypothetical protein